jgi:signal transduction histidine kinase
VTASASVPAISWVRPEDEEPVLDFWRVYDDNHEAIVAATAPTIAGAAQSGPVFRSLSPESITRANADAREQLRHAVQQGSWFSYERDLRSRAATYARRGLTLVGWHEIASAFVCFVTPLLMRAYGDDPLRAEGAVRALQRFHDWRAMVLFEEFLKTKEQMARDAEAARQRSEEELRSAQSLAAIGQVAGSIAHDFNNLLAIIQAHAHLLGQGAGSDTERVDGVEQIRRASETAGVLARQLMTLSREVHPHPPRVDVTEVVETTVKMLGPVLGSRVKLVVQATRPLAALGLESESLGQILLNLVVNARDAMPDGGTVTVATASVTRPGAASHGGEYARLSVSDEGTGMDAATRAHIFEPFFTTKGAAEGRG